MESGPIRDFPNPLLGPNYPWNFPKSFAALVGVLTPTVITYVILALVEPILMIIVPASFVIVLIGFKRRWNLDSVLSLFTSFVLLPYTPWLIYLAERSYRNGINKIMIEEVMES